MFYTLPPVGNPVCLQGSDASKAGSSEKKFFPSEQTYFYASGTAALAAALVAALKLKNIQSAEVILPAYGCPDLVSAVEFAGARPVLVDTEAGRPWLDLTLLAGAINGNTVAIVAVNLFGIGEQWPQLRELADNNNLVLIEDSAQYFPDAEAQSDWHGDLVVFSFGRGKPVSLLGGGAVLVANASLMGLLPEVEANTVTPRQRFAYKLKASLYNAVVSPCLYWLLEMLPFLHLGETRYHLLDEITGIDQVRLDLLACNIARYQQDTDACARSERLSAMLVESGCSTTSCINLPRICEADKQNRLLRYPLLVDAESRDRIYNKLKKAGLGVSSMYPTSLPKITGLSHILNEHQCYPNAEDFASRLITLPTHSHVDKENIEKMKAILCEVIK